MLFSQTQDHLLSFFLLFGAGTIVHDQNGDARDKLETRTQLG
jgi:hypothetical protein